MTPPTPREVSGGHTPAVFGPRPEMFMDADPEHTHLFHWMPEDTCYCCIKCEERRRFDAWRQQ